MNRILVVVAILLWPISGFAQIRYWDPLKRPPIPLSNALSRALDQPDIADATGYFATGQLYHLGNWHFDFFAADGRFIGVSVPTSGPASYVEYEVLDRKRHESTRQTFPKNLRELKKSIEQFAAKEQLRLDIESDERSLTVKYRTRRLLVHRLLKNGEFADELSEVESPAPGGLILRISEEGPIDWRRRIGWTVLPVHEYYWASHRDWRYLAESRTFVAVEWKMCLADESRWLPIAWWPSPGRELPKAAAAATRKQPPWERLVSGMYRILGRRNWWDWRNRPPISLRDALKISREALGKEAGSRYCVSSSLLGDQRSDIRYGARLLSFGAEDGTQRVVVVGMDGKASVLESGLEEDLNEQKRLVALSRPRRLCPIEEAERRLRLLFAKHGLHPLVRREQGALVASLNMREYKEYPWLMKEERIGEDLVERPGPRAGGFFLRIEYGQPRNMFTSPNTRMGLSSVDTPPEPYWFASRVRIPITDFDVVPIELHMGKGVHTPIPAAVLLDELTRQEESK